MKRDYRGLISDISGNKENVKRRENRKNQPVSHVIVFSSPTPVEIRVSIHLNQVLFTDGEDSSDEIIVWKTVREEDKT